MRLPNKIFPLALVKLEVQKTFNSKFYRDYAFPQIRWLVGKMTTVVKDRTYVRGSVVPFEEDLEHEFKGHRTISLQDRWIFLPLTILTRVPRLPVGMKPHHSGNPGGLVNTRQQWSKYICGMINSGVGGVLYGGIFDNGEVNGFMMSPYQRVHVALQLQEVLQRFQPPVPPELVSVQFVLIQEPFDQGVETDGRVALCPLVLISEYLSSCLGVVLC